VSLRWQINCWEILSSGDHHGSVADLSYAIVSCIEHAIVYCVLWGISRLDFPGEPRVMLAPALMRVFKGTGGEGELPQDIVEILPE
jgi:hypothetical protein